MTHLEIDKQNFSLYRAEIIDLYMNSFGKGESAQFLEKEAVNNYFLSLIGNGAKAILSFDSDIITGVLVFCPLVLDMDLPKSLSNKYDISKSIYIAELMVDAEHRGLGIAKLLLNKFFESMTSTFYNDAFIRVWDNNNIALRLYENNGFKKVDSIIQTKLKADTKDSLQMNKIYLWKKI